MFARALPLLLGAALVLSACDSDGTVASGRYVYPYADGYYYPYDPYYGSLFFDFGGFSHFHHFDRFPGAHRFHHGFAGHPGFHHFASHGGMHGGFHGGGGHR
jgi:hypothetical protein